MGRTTPRRRWPPRVDPSRRPRTTCPCTSGSSPSVVISPTRLSTSTCLSSNGISSKPRVSRLKKPIEALSNPPMAVNEATSMSFSRAKLVSPSMASSPGSKNTMCVDSVPPPSPRAWLCMRLPLSWLMELYGLQIGVHELHGVTGEILGIGPEVSPDAQSVGERRRDDRRGERLEDDRPLIVDLGEGAKERGEVHVAGAKVAAVALADVHVAQPVAGGEHRADHVGLLDVHVVRVEMDVHVGTVDLVHEAERLAGRVEQVGLEPVAQLEPEPDPGPRRMVRHPPQRARAILPTLGCWRSLVLAQLAVYRPAQIVTAEVTDQVDRSDEPPLARGYHVRVLARDVGLGGEELVAGHRESVLLQQAAGHGNLDLPRVE